MLWDAKAINELQSALSWLFSFLDTFKDTFIRFFVPQPVRFGAQPQLKMTVLEVSQHQITNCGASSMFERYG